MNPRLLATGWALTPELRKRHFDVVGPKLLTPRTRVCELPDGYELASPSSLADAPQHDMSRREEFVPGGKKCAKRAA